MGKNADHVQALREQLKRRILIRDGGAGLQATPNGRAAKVTSVKDVRVDDKGNLIVTKRDDFIGEGGNVAGIGGAIDENIGKVGTKEKEKVQRIVEEQKVNAPEEEKEQELLEGDGKSIVVDDKTIKVKGFDDADTDNVPYKSGGEVKWKHKPKGDEKSIHCEEKNTGDEFGLIGLANAGQNKVPVKEGNGISWKFPMNIDGEMCHRVNFESASDSNVTFNVTVSNGVATVKVGVYWK